MKTKSLYPIIAAMLALALASMACLVGATPAPTATPTTAPTNMPIPATATPVPPTNTPVPPTATATPNLAATVAAEATQQAGAVIKDIQAFLTSLDLPTEGSLGWYQDEPAYIDLEGYQATDFVPFAEDLEANNFIFKTDVTWESTGWPTCGILFRSNPGFENYYWFEVLRLSGLPAWFISYYKDNYWEFSPSGERFSDKLDQGNGATNELVLMADGNKFVVYINGQRQGQYFDDSKKSMKGYFAFAGWHESGTTTCGYENSWVWSLK